MGEHNYVMFDEGIETIINGITFRSVYAAHTDEKAIGVVIEADGKVLIQTGDTQYHRRLKNEYPDEYDFFTKYDAISVFYANSNRT